MQFSSFYISQSRTDQADTPQRFATILRDANNVSERKGPMYFNRHGRPGLIVNARFGPQWIQVVSPGVVRDRFSLLMLEILKDDVIAPVEIMMDSDLTEFENRIKSEWGGRDFEF